MYPVLPNLILAQKALTFNNKFEFKAFEQNYDTAKNIPLIGMPKTNL